MYKRDFVPLKLPIIYLGASSLFNSLTFWGVKEGLRPSLKSLSPSPCQGEGERGDGVNKNKGKELVNNILGGIDQIKQIGYT